MSNEKKDPEGRWIVAGLVATMAAIGAFGLSASWTGGYPSRAAAAYERFAKDAIPENHGKPDGSCERMGHSPVPKEICLTASAAPVVMIVGDSHAMSLNSGTQPMGINSMLIAGSSCLPLTTYELYGETEPISNRNCRQIAQSAVDAIARAPSIKTVVLASMGPVYLEPGNDLSQGGKRAADQEAALVDGYVQTIEAIQRMGRKVVFLIDNPELPFDPKNCIERRFSFSTPKCLLTRSEVDRRQSKYLTLVESIISQTGATLVDSTPVFCDQERCQWHDDRHSFYFDPHHLSVAGSQLVLHRIFGN